MWVLFSPPPPLFVNPDTRKIARGDEILFENVPQNANVILQRKFEIETFYYEGTHYRYKIYWQILIENVKTGTHGVLYRQEWTKSVFLRTNCQWIENMAYKVAEILTLPLLDITGTESIILKPEQQKLPLTSLYKDEYLSNVVTCDEEGRPNIVINQNG